MIYVFGIAALVFAGVAVWQSIRASRARVAEADAQREVAALAESYRSERDVSRRLRSALEEERTSHRDVALGLQREVRRLREALGLRESPADRADRLGGGS